MLLTRAKKFHPIFAASRKCQIVLGQMVLVKDWVGEIGAWEDGELFQTGFSKLGGTLGSSLLFSPVRVHSSRAAPCSLWAQTLPEVFHCCSSRAQILLLSPWLFCQWLSSTSAFLRVLAELFKAVIAPPLDIWEGYPSVGLASACVCVGPSW